MDERILKMLFDRHRNFLVFLATSLIGEMYAEDVVADAFLKLCSEGIPKWKDNPNPPPHAVLREYVKTECFAILRQNMSGKVRIKKYANKYLPYQKVSSLPPDIEHYYRTELSNNSEDFADILVIKAELMSMIADSINTLPSRNREVSKIIFDQVLLEGRDVTDVAVELGMSNDRVNRIRMKVERNLFKLSNITLGKSYWMCNQQKALYILRSKLAKLRSV